MRSGVDLDSFVGRTRSGRVSTSSNVVADRRVGAALALRVFDDDARTRVRVAIDGCAHDETRAAMSPALDGSLNDAAMARLGASLKTSSLRPFGGRGR